MVFRIAAIGLALGLGALWALQPPPPDGKGKDGRPPFDGPDFFAGGPPGLEQRKIVAQFDKDGDGRLNTEERKAAREFLKKEGGGRRPFGRGPGGPPGFGKSEPGRPGPRVSPGDVKNFGDAPLYGPSAFRTLFLEFENADWEAELQDFHGTDVDVPATLTVDGKKYPEVGVHFRGMSSYMGVPAGSKRSLNVKLDHAHEHQKLLGYKTLNLLNSHEDPTFLSTVLYSHVARQYIPAPKANLAKVVINGESWGVYTNVQQFDKIFTKENFGSDKGARWKVRGSPGGRGGLEYTGDDPESYKRQFEIKSGDKKESWQALIKLCKTLNETPPDKLEAALAPMLDIDGVLKFLALDVAVINNDGYWVRSSDYSLYLDDKGKFHVIPHDMNECFRPAQGPGMGGPPGMVRRFGGPGELLPGPLRDELNLTDEQRENLERLQKEVNEKLAKLLTPEQNKQLKELRDRGPGGPGGGPMMIRLGGGGSTNVDLDPLVGLTDARKPLRSKLLAVPALRARYLNYVREIAEKSFDWKNLGPVVAQYRGLIEHEVEIDTRKLESFEAFKMTTADDATKPGSPQEYPLRAFADQRRKYLLEYKEKKN